MKRYLQKYLEFWQAGLAIALSVIAIVLATVALTTQPSGTLDPAVEASILSSGESRLATVNPDGSTSGAVASMPAASSAPADPSTAAVETTANSVAAAPPVAVFLGDGYTFGNDASTPANRWTSLVADREGWTEVNLGAVGSGYLKAPASGRGAYSSSIPDVVAANPAIVVVSGGRNDVNEPSVAENIAISTLMSNLRGALPTATIVVVSPVWDDDQPPAALTAIGATLKASAEPVGASYLDIGQPLVGRSDLTSDGTDPNDAGHAAIADATVAALTAAGITVG